MSNGTVVPTAETLLARGHTNEEKKEGVETPKKSFHCSSLKGKKLVHDQIKPKQMLFH